MNNHSLWQYLDKLPAQSAAVCDWNGALEHWSGFTEFKKRYLLMNGKAMAVDCKTNCGLGCARKVVEHASNDIVAVCPEQEERPYPLSSQDILIYSLKRNVFHSDLCAALGITYRVKPYRESKVADCRHTWRIGEYMPEAGSVLPLFITFQQEPNELTEVILNLCLNHEKSFILIAPTRRLLNPRAEQLLEKRKALFLAMSEEIAFSSKGILQLKRSAVEVFRKYQTKKTKQKQQIFQLPEGTNWSDIHIRFMENPTVYIKKSNIYVSTAIRVTVDGAEKVVSCEEAGMARKNNKMPKDQWVLLYWFAKHGGKLDWDSPYASKKVKKQKQELSSSLRSYFALKEDPIEHLDDERCYRCRFRILPEGTES